MSVLPDRTAMSFEAWWTPVRVALIVWFIVHVVIFVSQWPAIAALRLADTDDAMRMAQVRDLLAGQGWWDLTQYRVNPADGGVLMHWSRIVDAPIAGGILLLRPLFGQPLAEQMVMAIWPPLHLGALLIAVALGYRHLPDRRIAFAAPLYILFCGYIMVQFRPLRVDHHGWQIFLAMLILWQALRPASRGAGLLGGLFAAMLLAVSIEGLPLAALFAGIAALRWALAGDAADRGRLLGYMAGLAGGAILFQFATRGPPGLAGTWCDSLSAPYFAAFVAAAAGTAATVALRPARPWQRLLLLSGAAALAALALVGTAPECARGPFAALDPIVEQYWYRRVLEGQPIWASKPHDMIYLLAPTLLGAIGALAAWRRCDDAGGRRQWATVLIALAGAAAVSLLVMRSAATAHLFAVPGCAWIGVRLWTWARGMARALPRILASLLAAATLPLFASMALALPLGWVFPALKPVDERTAASDRPERQNCLDAQGIAALDRLPATTILAPIDLGAPLIFWTPHRLVATPHHRNKAAMADTIRVFLGDSSRAEALVRARGATLIVVCRSANDFTQYRKARADDLAAQLYAGKPPAWLEPVPLGVTTGLEVWRVRPAGS
ncbi:hypothetical protein [Sphingopyxis panaciterrulae]|uniref:Uncharacterized protein n=1 Tax=Sphingopyxis panaciterrulae TaxID=462372 RepID=A0A7W9B2I4_9SPHN|nr:hypothetical protein [Sphingopyxis panaciterrulae]MBB5704811.1 hypothetical protein [Sphingopyxis panaciterrulae]